MEAKTHTTILRAVSRKKPGEIVFSSDFRGTGSQVNIKKALSRISRTTSLRRLGHGIYYIPKKDPILGEIRPDVDQVVKKLASREHVQIRPAGANALHELGLTTQVPTKRVYLTSGNAKSFRLGKIHIRFKPVAPRKLATRGKISSLVIQAVDELGPQYINEELGNKLRNFLAHESPTILTHDLKLASAKTYDYILKLLKTEIPLPNDRMAETHR